MRIRHCLLTFLLLATLLAVVGQSRSGDSQDKLPTDMTKTERKAIAPLEKAVLKAKADIEKHEEKLVAYFTADYPDVSSRLEKAGMPGQSAGLPRGTTFQPGFAGSRSAQELQQNAAKQKAAHDEAHKALQPLMKAHKEEIAKKTKEANEEAKKSKGKTKVDIKKIEEEVTKHYLKEALPICEKWADDDYRKEKKALAAKLTVAERGLKQKSDAIIKAHAEAGKAK